MPKIIADRVLETSTTTGTASYTLGGTVAGYRTFAAAPMVNGDTCDYYAEDVNLSGIPTGGWEVGLGTWGTGGVLARTTIYSSSNANALVSWAAGTRRIAVTLSANQLSTLTAGAAGGASPFINAAVAQYSYIFNGGL